MIPGHHETPCAADCTRPRPGSRHEHCKVCHRTFAGTASGDAHRTGRHGVDRRCRTDADLVAVGLWLTDLGGRQVWHGQASKSGVQRRRSTAERPEGTAQNGSEAIQ